MSNVAEGITKCHSRRKALIEVAAARQQAEFDRIIAEKKNERLPLEAE